MSTDEWLGSWQEEMTVASDPSTPPAEIRLLAGSLDPCVRAYAVMNPSCPEETLLAIAERYAGRTLPQPRRRCGAEDRAEAAAANPRCPPYILARLAETAMEMISSGDTGGAGAEPARVLAAVAANRRCPVTLMELLSCYPMASVRRAVAGNKRTPLRLRAVAAL